MLRVGTIFIMDIFFQNKFCQITYNLSLIIYLSHFFKSWPSIDMIVELVT
jgi:hypothetical protein